MQYKHASGNNLAELVLRYKELFYNGSNFHGLDKLLWNETSHNVSLKDTFEGSDLMSKEKRIFLQPSPSFCLL